MLRSMAILTAASMPGFGNMTSFDAVVVVTSVTLVFSMLVALCLILTAQGKIFDALTHRTQAKNQAAVLQKAAQAASAPSIAPSAAPAAPDVEPGIPPEVVAAIAAAVYYLEGDKATVHGIRRLPVSAGPRRRGAWGDAGVAESVRPF